MRVSESANTREEGGFSKNALSAVVVGDDEGRGASVERERVLLKARWRVSHA